MRLSEFCLAIAALLGTCKAAPAGPIRDSIPAPSNLIPGSIQIAEGVWYSNRTGNASVTDLGHELAAQISHCRFEDSTYENQGSGGSPYVKDCWVLHDNIVGDGDWTVTLLDQHQIAQHGSCAFGVTYWGNLGGEPYFLVGNDDVRRIVSRSIELFQFHGNGADRVGTKGRMYCRPGDRPVEWGLYWNPGFSG